jgi:microsomal dipeptidase-like Zn-dependent dipeptidase
MRKVFVFLSILLLVLLGLFFFAFPVVMQKALNRVVARPVYVPTERAKALHSSLLIADLHCDALLWNKDLLERSGRGHTDIPRLIEGNVALAAFTVVSKVPFGLNIERNDDTSDLITLLAVAQRWPISTWSSLTQRALYQANKLHRFAARSDGRLVLIKTKTDLDDYLSRRQKEPAITAGFLGIEGAQALDGDLANIDVLFEAGFRMMAPTHFFDTELGGSAHGVNKGGLTNMGREMVQRMETLGMMVDLAHASAKTIDDVLAVATKPVVVSHTGVRATCDNNRNLSDDQIRGIAATGGVIGIGFWKTATCGTDGKAIAQAIRHVADLVGVEHVGLGSDFDGAVPEPFDATGLVEITDALIEAGFSDEEIGLIMGGNVVRVLRQVLPD